MNIPATAQPAPYLDRIQSALRAGDQATAAREVDQWLAEAPEHPEALYFRAVIERSNDQLDAAMATLLALQVVDPVHSRGLQELGHLRRRRGDTAGALIDYQRATRLNPGLLASWRGQVETLKALGRPGAAARALVEVQYLESLPQPLLIVIDLTARGRLAKAEALCKKFMQKNPRHVEGMRLLAAIALEMGALEEADLLLDTAHRLAPDNGRVSVDRVLLLRRQQRFAEALAAADALAANQPDNLQYQSLAGVEAMQVGDYERALARFDTILAAAPEDPITLTSKGHTLKTRGDAPSAIASYRAAIAAQAGYGEAWYSLANLKTYRFDDDDIARMTALCAEAQLDQASRVFLHFALGKAFEDAGNFDAAFEHYSAGNAARHRQSGYSAERIHEEFEATKQTCSPELFADFAGAGCMNPDPIFIVGLPRAGSTLLEQILASHSQVDGTLELPNVLSLVQRLRRSEGLGYPEALAELDAEVYRELGETYLRDTRIHRQDAPFFIDKMPNNFRHIGLIKLMLPNAKIIDARRNPMACCFSGFKQLFAEGQEFSYDLVDLAHYYRDYVELMAHWHRVFPEQILQVNNEDVIDDLEGQVRRLLAYCQLPFEDSCVQYWQTDRAVKTPSSEQVRQPISAAGQDQWRNFEQHLAPLAEALGPDLVSISEAMDRNPS